MSVPEQLPSSVVSRVLDAVVTITSDLELDAVLQRIVECGMDLTGARYGALGVLDGDTLGKFLAVGVDPEQAAHIPHWPHGTGLLGDLIRDPQPIRVSEISQSPRSTGFPPGHPPMHTFLGVPVRVRDQVYGNLYLTDKADGKPFTSQDEAAVVALASVAGAAIDNAKLYAQAKQVGIFEDRDRIARDLHDVVIQRLFACAMSLMSVQPLIAHDLARARIEETVSDLDETISQIRSTIFSLHTATDPHAPSIDDRLSAAVKAATTTLGFAPQLQIEVAPSAVTGATGVSIPAEVADQLVVVAGEALTNVARHANASSVTVHVHISPGVATLTVTDDGVGMTPGGRRSGLRNIAIRAQELGGDSDCIALPEGGTQLTWWASLR